ncbi:uncharacterized protein POS17_2924 [Pseudomonas sp. Os17]|nr:uncharacterized protein POS17_2924 [Pseudomonas sp. Os17]BAQ80931.1 uncharacterized protein PST29_3042 [Pseudomonas sp. St29]
MGAINNTRCSVDMGTSRAAHWTTARESRADAPMMRAARAADLTKVTKPRVKPAPTVNIRGGGPHLIQIRSCPGQQG